MALADAAGSHGNAQIVSCFARSPESRGAFAGKYGCRGAGSYAEVLKDPEVEGILLATPHSTHADLVCEAASAGKHVFVDKPFTLKVADARRAIAACEKAGVVLQVGHHRRRFGATRRIRQMIDSGEIGMVHELEATITNPNNQNPRPGWRDDPEECPVGGMTGLGVHKVDNFHYLAGPVKRVCAFSKRLLGRGNIDDVTDIIFEFESGPLGHLNVTYVVPTIIATAAYGTEASAWSEDDGARLYVQKKDEKARSEVPVERVDAVADELDEFARCVRGGGKPETGGPEGLEVVAVLEAVHESARSGRVVELAEFRG